MKITHQRQHKNKKNAIGVLAAGVAGAVAIAGVAVAATIALKDEKTRKKVKEVLIDVKDQALDYAEKLQKDPQVVEGVQKIKKITTETKKAVEKNTE